MVDRHSMPGRTFGNPPIASRDADGNERWLIVVDHPVGLLSIADDTMVRIMSPNAVVDLITALLAALGGMVPPARLS